MRETVTLGFAFGRFEFDGRAKRLRLEGREVPLPPRELQLLGLFLDHPAEWLEDSWLERGLWPNAVPPTGELDRLMRELAAALEPGADGVTTLQTVKGRGRRLLIPVRALGEPDNTAQTESAGIPRPGAARSSGAAHRGKSARSPSRPALSAALAGGRSAQRTPVSARQVAAALFLALALGGLFAAFRWAERAIAGRGGGRSSTAGSATESAQMRAAAAAELEKGLSAARGYDVVSRRTAITHFEAALQLDSGPRHQAAAHGALASVLVLDGELERARLEAQAALAAGIALGYEARLAEPLAARAFVQLFAGRDPVAARASAERVLALDALHLGGRRALAWTLVVEGRFDEALAELGPARRVEVFDPEVATDEGWILYLSGRSLEARQLLARVVRQEPLFRRAHAALAALHLSERRLAAAAMELEVLDALEAGATRDEEHLRQLASSDPALLDASEAARLLEERAAHVDQKSSGAREGPAGIEQGPSGLRLGAETEAARIYAQFGDSARALAALERGLARREADAVLARIDPAFAPLRSSAEFKRLLARSGVPELAPRGADR